MGLAMTSLPKRYITPEEYLAKERKAEYKSEYVLVAQDKCHVEQFTRQPDNRWLLWETDDLEGVLSLPSIGCKLKLTEIYAKVTFGAPSGE
jgi:hypothetical protein